MAGTTIDPGTLTCPRCGGHDLTEPHWNGYVTDATECRDCGTRMGTEAVTPGTEVHQFIWNSINEDFRAAGYQGVSINGPGWKCCGGLEELAAPSAAWIDADGWLWCRMHLDTLLRETPAAP